VGILLYCIPGHLRASSFSILLFLRPPFRSCSRSIPALLPPSFLMLVSIEIPHKPSFLLLRDYPASLSFLAPPRCARFELCPPWSEICCPSPSQTSSVISSLSGCADRDGFVSLVLELSFRSAPRSPPKQCPPPPPKDHICVSQTLLEFPFLEVPVSLFSVARLPLEVVFNSLSSRSFFLMVWLKFCAPFSALASEFLPVRTLAFLCSPSSIPCAAPE